MIGMSSRILESTGLSCVDPLQRPEPNDPGLGGGYL